MYIMEQERVIMEMVRTLRSLSTSYLYEVNSECTGRPSPANRDCWGTLHMNLLAMRREADIALAHLAKEFATDKDYRNAAR